MAEAGTSRSNPEIFCALPQIILRGYSYQNSEWWLGHSVVADFRVSKQEADTQVPMTIMTTPMPIDSASDTKVAHGTLLCFAGCYPFPERVIPLASIGHCPSRVDGVQSPQVG